MSEDKPAREEVKRNLLMLIGDAIDEAGLPDLGGFVKMNDGVIDCHVEGVCFSFKVTLGEASDESTPTERKTWKVGDVVYIKDDQGPKRKHFRRGCYALINSSDNHLQSPQYTLWVPNSGEHSWYSPEHLLWVGRALTPKMSRAVCRELEAGRIAGNGVRCMRFSSDGCGVIQAEDSSNP